jgi:hypothetical protein
LATDKVRWKELLDRLGKGAWKINRKQYRAMDVMCAEDILYSLATEREIEKAEEKDGKLSPDLKDMFRVANRCSDFKGFETCDQRRLIKGFAISWVEAIFSAEVQLASEGLTSLKTILDNYVYDFARKELNQKGIFSGKMVQLQAGAEFDDCYHYIIHPKMWKDNAVGRAVAEGEYQYWHWALWQASIDVWNSVGDWAASCVNEVEAIMERREKVTVWMKMKRRRVGMAKRRTAMGMKCQEEMMQMSAMTRERTKTGLLRFRYSVHRLE